MNFISFSAAVCLAAIPFAHSAAPISLPDEALQTQVTPEMLNADIFAEWAGGEEKLIAGEGLDRSPGAVVWTTQSSAGIGGVEFGAAQELGARHLRVGFSMAIPIGSILARGGGKLSVLKPDAAFPGDLNKDSDWIPAQRLIDGKISEAEVASSEYALWVLPPGTTTQALRFTHTPEDTDTNFAGSLGAVLILEQRLENLNSVADVTASSSNPETPPEWIKDGTYLAWQNNEGTEEGAIISPEAPAWIEFTWPKPVEVDALLALEPYFSAAEIQIYKGTSDQPFRDDAAGAWQTIKKAEEISHAYPKALWPNWLNLNERVKTRAVRLLITAASLAERLHQHQQDLPRGGTRVQLGELMVLRSLGNEPLKPLTASAETSKPSETQPLIPIKFTLKEGGFVTLAVADSTGKRVRNLVSETWYSAGENTAWWDGMNDLERDPEAVRHGIYHIPERFVEPGNFHVTGLVRGAVTPSYEFSIYSGGGKVPWPTADRTGAWLSNHMPPNSALFVPGSRTPTGKPMIYLGSTMSEGRDGLMWVDLDGTKLGGQTSVGGAWTGAPYLARDDGEKAIPDHIAYSASVAGTGSSILTKAELRLSVLMASPSDRSILRYEFDAKTPNMMGEISGLTAYNGLIVTSLPAQNQLLFVDAKTATDQPNTGTALGTAPMEDPRGILFDPGGRLLVLSGKKLLRFAKAETPAQLTNPETLIATGLEDPQSLTLDLAGNIYISDRGASQQVKVYGEQSGKYALLGTIGKPGVPKSGPYDPLRLIQPAGLTIDEKNQLWVAECDSLPKRISVWSLDGDLLKAFYGPSKYGGGGTIDPHDKSLFYYTECGGTLEFKLDWNTGESKLQNILYRGEFGFGASAPETAVYHNGQRFFTNCYNTNPGGGSPAAYLFQEKNGTLHPVAGAGLATGNETLAGDEFKPYWPEGVTNLRDPNLWRDGLKNWITFVWSDADGNSRMDPGEVAFQAIPCTGVTVMPDLAFCISSRSGPALRVAPVGFSDQGTPRYDFDKAEILAESTDLGGEILVGKDGFTVATTGIQPFAQESIAGVKPGVSSWSYPNLWQGIHGGHSSPLPDRPGELIATTRLMGGFFEPRGSDAGQLFAINGNHGNFFIFTADGLFVATVFKDFRIGRPWAMPVARRGMALDNLTLDGENFWPTLTQTEDGNIYVVDGARTSILKLDGLESIRRLPDCQLTVTAENLEKSRLWLVANESRRQKTEGGEILEVARVSAAPVVNGKLEDWSAAKWVDIDKSGVRAYFDSNTKPFDVTAALAVSKDRLYAAFRTGNPGLLQNTGVVPNAPFKTGGALDLMIGVDPKADPNRANPAPGDLRLIVTRVDSKPLALLYRAVVPGTAENQKIPFSSPLRTITFDKVEDVSSQLEFAAAEGNYEFSLPLSVLNLKPQPGLTLKGDIGILRGNGMQTAARVYWNNKATGINADVPTEAALVPNLWGALKFK